MEDGVGQLSTFRGHPWILGGQSGRARHRLVDRGYEGLFSSTHGTQPVDCSGLGAHDEPRLRTAAARIVAGRLPPDLPEHFLQDLLGRRGVAQDAADESEGEASEGVVEAAEGLAITLRDAGEKTCRYVGWRHADVRHDRP